VYKGGKLQTEEEIDQGHAEG